MKKLIVILIAALSFTAASAQSRKDSYNSPDRSQENQTRGNRYNNDQQPSNDYAYNNYNAYGNGRNNDRSRQENYNRKNQQYDQRFDGYRNDRSQSNYESDRRIREVEQERQEKSGSFGNGMVIGGIAGLLIGILARH